jgi:cytochrome P450
LPSMVVSDYLGIPESDREWVRQLADRFSTVFEPPLDGPERAAMLHDVVPFVDFLDDLIAERRRNPKEDFISQLAAIPEDEGGMTQAELHGNLMHLTIAGNETTTNLLQHMIVQLTRFPDLRAQMAEDPDLMTAFMEETLRYEAPIQILGRITKEDVALRDEIIPAGSVVGLGVGSANRDEERFADPDSFDPSRADLAHLSLAVGPHFCIGAPLARLEGIVALEMLTGEFKDLVVDTDTTPEWKPDILLRGYTKLGVRYSATA